jgi:ATP-dependent Clp protease ATP-binding subunit ClpA
MNRIDKTVVFRPLGTAELRAILAIELDAVQERILTSATAAPFVFAVTDPAREYLLREGTDLKYGARHLKRAIDRHLVHPLSNLIATGQVGNGDLIRVDFDGMQGSLTFAKDSAWTPAAVMARLTNPSTVPDLGTLWTGAAMEPLRWFKAKTTKR